MSAVPGAAFTTSPAAGLAALGLAALGLAALGLAALGLAALGLAVLGLAALGLAALATALGLAEPGAPAGVHAPTTIDSPASKLSARLRPIFMARLLARAS